MCNNTTALPNTQSTLTALSPLDGRYHSQLTALANLFSEFGFFRYRVQVEVEYLIFLSQKQCIPSLSSEQKQQLREVSAKFSLEDAASIKQLEYQTKHDVKAVELFLRQQLTQRQLPGGQHLHLALTSEDVNSLAYSLMIQAAREEILLPELKKLLEQLADFATQQAETSMLARTHGQAAVPTTVGKEFANVAVRLMKELRELEHIQIEAKLTGAVGNFNAHVVTFPDHDWQALSREFVESFGLTAELFTTQILPAESYSRLFASLQRVNSILIDLNQDIWRYISDGYFSQKAEAGQVGSSTMPQKVNPIEFENSEGNLGLANSLLGFFIQKLPVSRLQRDLSDSTVKRSIGSAFGYCLLGYASLRKGAAKLSVNTKELGRELNQHWEVLAEALQVVLRLHGDAQGYEKLKTFSQGKRLTQHDVEEFIDSLPASQEVKATLHNLQPTTYLGLASELTHLAVKDVTNYLQGES